MNYVGSCNGLFANSQKALKQPDKQSDSLLVKARSSRLFPLVGIFLDQVQQLSLAVVEDHVHVQGAVLEYLWPPPSTTFRKRLRALGLSRPMQQLGSCCMCLNKPKQGILFYVLNN